MKSKDIAILLTCHNRKDTTLECLKTAYASVKKSQVKVDIYLTDDGSTDGTSEAVASQYPDVNIIKGDGNLFWGRGMISSWKEAAKYDYDFYMWLNDDSTLLEDAIDKLLKDSALFNYQSIIAGVCKAGDSDAISYSGYLLKDKKKLLPQGKPVICDFFNGNIVLIPKSVFLKVGFLDEVFHHPGGDIDYGLRAKKYGINSYISSDVVGVCETNDVLLKWCNPKVPFKERLKNFNSPLCFKPRQVYIFERRHTSLHMALFRSGIIYIRLVFPKLWILMGKAKRY
ncbi:glycosyltransferase family 2 protein [Mucilaginibacter ginsenosidivorax]|uniref:Glycosyltransferase family 2 protein n=1 Tax=Mucilaginibacter ginsenosidivorax TaxID=862126 RepID=A0A5B8W2S7_9SPHI|nr:glycosyltransferase family 2 protein [Mucilaginibacter ginsenosidivorax]QEC78081.1 glycosyltransferase family 2 protein [Mucilaginibacter ginsenosidivorax]